MEKANIVEIYSSIQGEGLYVGERHCFVRFYGCNLSCKFCDERKKTFTEHTLDEVIADIIKEKERTISLTGGEPLLHADFLKEILPILKEKGFRIYLETNGTLKNELLKILDYIDIISMDLKLPSSTGLKSYWKEHRAFLKEAIKRQVFIKAVVTNNTSLSDIQKALNLARRIDKNIPFILQPVSYNGNVEKIRLLDTFFNSAEKELDNVRVIPQVHKILGVR